MDCLLFLSLERDRTVLVTGPAGHRILDLLPAPSFAASYVCAGSRSPNGGDVGIAIWSYDVDRLA